MENVKIIKALANFQKDCPELDLNSEVKVKTKTGGSYSFRYADLPYIMETIQPALSANELVPLFDFPENVIRLTIYHTSGETVTSQLPLKLSASPQENGSLITYYRRYLICSLLNITADKDDDGNTFEQQDRKVSTTEPENWLNINPSKASKKLTLEFIKAWELVNINGGKVQDVRKEWKVSKPTALKLEDKEAVNILTIDNFNLTLDGKLDQINNVLNSFAMTIDQRTELNEIVLAAKIDEVNLKGSGMSHEDLK